MCFLASLVYFLLFFFICLRRFEINCEVLLCQGNVSLVFISQVESGADVKWTTTQQELNSWSSICSCSVIRWNRRETHKNPATLSMHSCVTLFLSHHVKCCHYFLSVHSQLSSLPFMIPSWSWRYEGVQYNYPIPLPRYFDISSETPVKRLWMP